MKNSHHDIRVVIPAYNAEKTLGGLISEIFNYVRPDKVFVVDDGSLDSTSSIANQFGILSIRHKVNQGKGAALRTAFEYICNKTSAEALVTIDSDRQHLPQELPSFFDTFRQMSSDLIIGCRSFDPSIMPWPRVLSNKVTNKLLTWKLGQTIKDSQCGYRLYSRKLLEQVNLKTVGYETESEVLIEAVQARFKLEFIPITTIYANEKSYINGVRDTFRFIKVYLKN